MRQQRKWFSCRRLLGRNWCQIPCAPSKDNAMLMPAHAGWYRIFVSLLIDVWLAAKREAPRGGRLRNDQGICCLQALPAPRVARGEWRVARSHRLALCSFLVGGPAKPLALWGNKQAPHARFRNQKATYILLIGEFGAHLIDSRIFSSRGDHSSWMRPWHVWC
jgi:hypothetical protein